MKSEANNDLLIRELSINCRRLERRQRWLLLVAIAPFALMIFMGARSPEESQDEVGLGGLFHSIRDIQTELQQREICISGESSHWQFLGDPDAAPNSKAGKDYRTYRSITWIDIQIPEKVLDRFEGTPRVFVNVDGQRTSTVGMALSVQEINKKKKGMHWQAIVTIPEDRIVRYSPIGSSKQAYHIVDIATGNTQFGGRQSERAWKLHWVIVGQPKNAVELAGR